jgi:hypothetical protein
MPALAVEAGRVSARLGRDACEPEAQQRLEVHREVQVVFADMHGMAEALERLDGAQVRRPGEHPRCADVDVRPVEEDTELTRGLRRVADPVGASVCRFRCRVHACVSQGPPVRASQSHGLNGSASRTGDTRFLQSTAHMAGLTIRGAIPGARSSPAPAKRGEAG